MQKEWLQKVNGDDIWIIAKRNVKRIIELELHLAPPSIQIKLHRFDFEVDQVVIHTVLSEHRKQHSRVERVEVRFQVRTPRNSKSFAEIDSNHALSSDWSHWEDSVLNHELIFCQILLDDLVGRKSLDHHEKHDFNLNFVLLQQCAVRFVDKFHHYRVVSRRSLERRVQFECV